MQTLTEFRLPLWHWSDSQDTAQPDGAPGQPAEPATGQGWFDPDSNGLFVWDGQEWVSVPQD